MHSWFRDSKSPMGKRWGSLLLVAATAVGLTACAQGTTGATASSPVTVGVFPVATSTLAARESGAFDKLHVQTVNMASGAGALPLIKSGRLSGFTDVTAFPILLGLSQNIGIKVDRKSVV